VTEPLTPEEVGDMLVLYSHATAEQRALLAQADAEARATPAPDTLPYRWYDAKTDQYVIAARDIDVIRDAFDDYRDAHNGWCARAIIAATREETT